MKNKETLKKQKNPDSEFHKTLAKCSKSKDLTTAISIFDSETNQNRLTLHHLNTLLYICSSNSTDPNHRDLAIQYGFKIYTHMTNLNIPPNEASITALARLAAAKRDGDRAFELVKNLGSGVGGFKLRSFHPALFCFCEEGEADKAYEVEEWMRGVGLRLEEVEIAALLRVSVEKGRTERVYGYLHKLRECVVGCVGEETGEVVEGWFRGECAAGVVGRELGEREVREFVFRNGGGWHGLGWLGSGRWSVEKGGDVVGSDGRCRCCGEWLACVDIDQLETERFAQSVAGLALEREAVANFREFQDWLEKHGVYEAIVDGANVGLYQQNFADGGFSMSQLDAVVRELYNRSGKWPLVVLHQKRIRALLEITSHRKIIEEWRAKGAIYTTPHGSNDDWYWLYAAVKLKCLLVTNDEMRDHIFELLGRSFFVKWKERHQVHYTFTKGCLQLQLPPPYSLVIQESEKGWHVPIVNRSCEESAQSWLCITRPRVLEASSQVLMNAGNPENCLSGSNSDKSSLTVDERNRNCLNGSDSDKSSLTLDERNDNRLLKNDERNGSGLLKNGDDDTIQSFSNDIASCTRKRKERSPSPPPQ